MIPEPAHQPPGPPAVKFEVRHYDIQARANAAALLPLVETALRTVGRGSALLTDRGLLVVAPVDLLANLGATIDKYKDAAPTPDDIQIYYPVIDLTDGAEEVYALVTRLGLLPPDMRCSCFSGPGRCGLVVAGPLARKDYYQIHVMPSIRSLAALVPRHGLPRDPGTADRGGAECPIGEDTPSTS